ncbi:MAG: signal peptidase I [Patescibacteria group bacterium]|nr:signal peptidase I [Patescibacteria group bacterium]
MEQGDKHAAKKRFWTRWNIIALAIVVLAIVALMRTFVFETFFVSGDSMSPTITNGELLFVDRLAYLHSGPQRGDIVVAIPRTYPGEVVKRIIGLPGEWFSIENSQIVIRNSRTDQGVNLDESYLKLPDTPAVGITRWNLDPEEYFALGDNRSVSIDSRELGPIDLWSIKGKVVGAFDFSTLQYKAF